MSWLEEFLFPKKSTAWITMLRVGLGLQVGVYCLSLWHDWNYLFLANSNGLISRELAEAILSLKSPFIPTLGWLVQIGFQCGISEETTLRLAAGCLLGSGLCLCLGFFSRSAAIAAWFLHLAARHSGGLAAYGVDTFMTIGLFYLMLSPSPGGYAVDALFWPRKIVDPRQVGFWQRVLQLHLCLIYFFGGLTKALGAGWWDGSSMWRALTRSPFDVLPPDLLVRWSFVLPSLGIVILVIETAYPIFIWPDWSRRFWLPAVLAMHVAIGITMGLYLFALIMIILNLAAFGPGLIARWPLRAGKEDSDDSQRLARSEVPS